MAGSQFFNRSAFEVVAGYFHHFQLPWRQEGDTIYADLPGGSSATVQFDEQGRVAAVSMGAINSQSLGDRTVG
jgi:hypothetical protein